MPAGSARRLAGRKAEAAHVDQVDVSPVARRQARRTPERSESMSKAITAWADDERVRAELGHFRAKQVVIRADCARQLSTAAEMRATKGETRERARQRRTHRYETRAVRPAGIGRPG